MTTQNLLVELFVEELPPKALKKLGQAFSQVLHEQLVAQGLASAQAAVQPFASPRRLAAHISAVAAQAADQQVAQKLMPVSVGLDAQGQATPALLKKLQALSLDASAVPSLRQMHDGKAQVLMYDQHVPGVSLAAGLQKALQEAIAKLPIPKVMSYQLQDGWTTVNFVRPAHGLVALYGDQVVPLEILGLTSSNTTQGHRFEATVNPVVIPSADAYAQTLQHQGAVIASFTERRAEMERQLQQAAAQLGLQVIEDQALLDEVTALVERPNVLVCAFEKEFLAVPHECLILTMKANQKYFPLLDAQGQLSHQFLIVSNIQPADPSAVIQGNERVVRPRLADAQFFFNQDRKKTLASRLPGLAQVVYHNKLGSQGQRMERVCKIARQIALWVPDTALAEEAARLAKTDLLTDMVGEFPELQGLMGGYYARHDGLDDVVARAIEDHYKPRFAGDSLPRDAVGCVVALADKLETLVGLFGIGQTPSGDKDPFALRRHALGIIRILVERELPLALTDLLDIAYEAFPAGMLQDDPREAVHSFFIDRLKGYLKDNGYATAEVEAVVAAPEMRIWAQLPQRLSAVRAFAALPEAAALAAANKRIHNILKKTPEANAHAHVSTVLLQEPAERALYAAMQNTLPISQAQWEQGDYTQSLQTLAVLRTPVDDFFNDVMVNAPEADLRMNRLGLLNTLYGAMNRVADLAKLAA